MTKTKYDPEFWRNIRINCISSATPPPEWPENVKPISIDGVSLIGVDLSHNLYWDGNKIHTVSRLKLNFSEKVATWLVVASTVIMATIETLKFLGYEH